MTNPYHQGSPGWHGDPAMPTGLPGFGQRGFSYASVASGATTFPRAGSFAHLLNPVGDGADHPAYSSRNHDTEPPRNGVEQNGTAGRQHIQRNPQLPSFSRAFEVFMQGSAFNGFGSHRSNQGFFTPTYLEGSTYVQRLEEQHKARSQQREGQITSSTGPLPSRGSSLSLPGSKLVPPSHRGIGYESVEKPPPFDDDDTLMPLPSRWNKNDKSSSLDVSGDELDARCTAQRSTNERERERERDHEASSVRADHYMPPQCGIYYFEVTIVARKREDTTIGIGFSDKSVSLSRPPGWEPNSWGYHGDDGNIFASQNVGKHYGPTFTTGDVIGCGVNFRTGCAFYTKNGEHLGIAFRDVKGPNLNLYPTVGLKKNGEHIRVNFGQIPFVYDIDGMMKKEKISIHKQISATSTANLAPPLNETDLIQQLVLQFLQHDGYVDTARAFAGEIQGQKQALSLDPNAKIEGISITDDEDANKRQRIRRAVLEGDIDRALKYTKTFYPQVLDENEQVHFRLRCRKFIEMIRREAELNMTGGDKRSNGHHQEMEIDDIDMDGNPNSQHLVNEALIYGQGLSAEYATDSRKDIQKALSEIFSLMAYANPLKEKEVAHLLDRKGRVAVAEELNSAILQSLGKSSRAALENVYAQTSVLLEDLRQEGGPGSFVTIQGVIDQIPKSQPF